MKEEENPFILVIIIIVLSLLCVLAVYKPEWFVILVAIVIGIVVLVNYESHSEEREVEKEYDKLNNQRQVQLWQEERQRKRVAKQKQLEFQKQQIFEKNNPDEYQRQQLEKERELERKRKIEREEREKRLEEEYEKTREYLDLIIKYSESILKDEGFSKAFDNFIETVPINIFSYNESYYYFCFQLMKENYIGFSVLNIYDNYFKNKPYLPIDNEKSKEIDFFIENRFKNFEKYLKTRAQYKNDYDFTFVILFLIITNISKYAHKRLSIETGTHLGDINKLSLDECLFNYYYVFKNKKNDYLIDPWISWFTHLLIYHKKIYEASIYYWHNSYPIQRDKVIDLINNKKDEFEYKIFELEIQKDKKNKNNQTTIQDVDLMSGREFENFVAQLFSKLGFTTQLTKYSGDFGVDILAEKEGVKYAIQTKCYSKAVSNSAIQEITAGINHFNCHKGIVVSNSTFTKAAIQLARTNNISLWDRNKLEEMINELE